jgi:mannose-1-phosphate guanylyltransferase
MKAGGLGMSGKSSDRYALVMAGGSGQRFWPKSRKNRPKQLLSILGEKTMLEQTLERIAPLCPPENILIVTNAEYEEPVRVLAEGIPGENIIGEPFGRDTSACVGLSAAWVRARNPEGLIGVVSADHVIHDVDQFRACFDDIFDLVARRDCLMTIGVTPEFPATGYGYIQVGEVIENPTGETVFHEVQRFHEKPCEEEARRYLASGEFLWNAGTFAWSCGAIWDAMASHTPELAAASSRMQPFLEKGTAPEELYPVLRREYEQLAKRPVDKAIMQQAGNVVVARARFDWDDVGAFPSLEKHFPLDDHGNLIRDAVFEQVDCRDCIVLGDAGDAEKILIGGIGLEGMMIVRTPDALLICPKNKAQDIKHLVEKIGKNRELESWT